MKLRIRGNSIRFRLSRSELDELGSRGVVRDSINFGAGASLSYGIEVSSADSLTVRHDSHTILATLPKPLAQRWALPEEVAVQGNQPLNASENLSILLEKDSSCLAPREGEEDADSFPNPAAEGN
jgi:hypothetical protein